MGKEWCSGFGFVVRSGLIEVKEICFFVQPTSRQQHSNQQWM
jgi:hypothetical protein